MKVSKLLVVLAFAITCSNADDVMQKSMSLMEKGMVEIQKGFLNNNLDSIKNGVKLVKDGNNLFSDEKLIAQYLPDNKKHMSNMAENSSKRITKDSAKLEQNLSNKAFLKAADAYSDILNACSSCHSIVRSW